MALISAADFRDHYPQLTGTGDDPKIDKIIARADDLMARLCGFQPYDSGGGAHTLTVQTYTMYLDGPSEQQDDALCLCARPVATVTSVHVDPTRVYGAGALLVNGTDYEVDTLHGMLIRKPSSSFRWDVGFRAIKVIGTFGYATTPPGLIALAAMVARHLWDLRRRQGLSSLNQGGQSANMEEPDVPIPQAIADEVVAFVGRCSCG